MARTMSRRRWVLPAVGMAMVAAGCGDSTAPLTVAAVEVTSPIGALLDLGWNAQLAAAAKDAQGAGMSGVSFTWTSSNAGVVSVSASGQVQALAAGTATVRATAEGVSGSLAITVVDADLAGIGALLSAAYVVALVAGTSSGVKTALQAATGQCASGVQQGNLENVERCIAAARAQATGASDPTDRALLAVLMLIVDHVERLLNG